MFSFSSLPKSKRNIRKVQLGAGHSPSDSHINVDYFQGHGIDIAHDLTKALPFPDNSIEEFYSHHVLEHFNYPQLQSLLDEVYRCLKPGGVLVSRLPDFEYSALQFLSLPPGPKRDNMMICIYGGNAFGWEPPDAHKHFFGWTSCTMRELLIAHKFVIEKCESTDSTSDIPVIDFVVRKAVLPQGGCMWGERTVEVPWLLDHVKPGSALDVGSAESCYVNQLLDKGVSQLALNDVRKFSTHEQDSRVKCVVGDIRTYEPQEIGMFDNVLCISTLEHIALHAYDQRREVSTKDSAFYPQKEAFNHMMKFLKPDGQMLLTIPYGKYEDSGWVIVYDHGMIGELIEPYEVIEETYYTLTNRDLDLWVKCPERQCPPKGMDVYAGNMRATSCCCLVLKNK